MNSAIKIFLILVSSLFILAVVGFIGLQVQPTSFPAFAGLSGKLERRHNV